VSVQHAPGFTIPTTNLDGEVNLTVLTYNVWGLPCWINQEPNARYAKIASDIEHLHPDLVLLQEVWTKSAAAVAPTNGGWMIARAPSANFFRRNGLMILSRLPISGGEFHPFNKAAFPDSIVRKGALKVTVQAPGGQRLNIWDVHLQSDAPQVRRRQIQQLAAWVRDGDDGQAADLVGGDFNTTPASPEFKLLSRELGQTAHELAHLPFSPTYDGLSPDPRKAQTIDYLFIRPRAPINRLEAAPSITFTNGSPRQRFSDHVALEVALRFHAQSSFASTPITNGFSHQPVAYSSHPTTPLGY
jgi:endonuclease/exonuclease/phosphatase family metal-dependent hydrolase